MSSDLIAWSPNDFSHEEDGVIPHGSSRIMKGLRRPSVTKGGYDNNSHNLGRPDEDLLQQVGFGERNALSALFLRHACCVRNVALQILRDTAEAEDLLQEVFLFIYRKAGLYDPTKSSARSWIIQVAYHRAFNRRHYLTARQHYQALQLDEEILDPRAVGPEAPTYCSSIDAIFGQELLAKCQSRLSSEQMQTIELFFFEGYTLKEIAEHTGQSLTNVRSYYYRGLERMRKLLTPEKARTK